MKNIRQTLNLLQIRDQLKEELNKELPGVEIQYNMAPGLRKKPKSGPGKKIAAVLILLYPFHGSLFTVFIKRPRYSGVHSGQISLPGGKMEFYETNPAETALREAHEEIGINPRDIEILGKLTGLHIPVSKIQVIPFVGFSIMKPHFQLHQFEVEFLIETAVDEFLKPATRQEKLKILFIKRRLVPFYNIDGNHIWGATAMIISEFVEILKRIDYHPE